MVSRPSKVSERGYFHAVLPNVGANFASGNGHLDILEWLSERNILPEYQGVNWASKNGQLDILKCCYVGKSRYNTRC